MTDERSGVASTLIRNWKITLPIAIVLGAVGAWLAFGIFGIHTLFIDEKVDEAPPEFASGAGASGLASDAISQEQADAMTDAMEETDMPATDEVDEGDPMTGDVTTVVSGEFIDRSHPTTGTAVVLTDGNQRFLRFEGFETDNGPDLNVYLFAAPPDAPTGELAAAEFFDLGDLKGNIGPQNYEIPPEVDLDKLSTVVIWCVRFSVAFGAAPLA